MGHIAGHICTVILWQKQVVTCATNALERRPSGAHLYVPSSMVFHEQNQVLARATLNVLGAGTAPLRGAFV